MNKLIKLSNLLLFLFLLMIPHVRMLSAEFLSNLGWIYWFAYDQTGDTKQAGKAQKILNLSNSLDPQNPQSITGLGLIQLTLFEQPEAALRLWRQGTNAHSLIHFGDIQVAHGNWDQALIYYQGAASSTENVNSQAMFRAGLVCQNTVVHPQWFSSSSLVFCEDYFVLSGQNLIVNGKFATGTLEGWFQRRWQDFSGDYTSDVTEGVPAPSGAVVGSTANEIGGLSQTVNLPSGTIVRFSTWLKTRRYEEGSTARILHILWQTTEGVPGGRQLIEIPVESSDWTYYELVTEMPMAQNAEFRFSPVLLTGPGKILIDDVELQIVSP